MSLLQVTLHLAFSQHPVLPKKLQRLCVVDSFVFLRTFSIGPQKGLKKQNENNQQSTARHKAQTITKNHNQPSTSTIVCKSVLKSTSPILPTCHLPGNDATTPTQPQPLPPHNPLLHNDAPPPPPPHRHHHHQHPPPPPPQPVATAHPRRTSSLTVPLV